ncbi:head-tail connector protein [Clostridioides difficile]|nr:head-tail connector protein [Clostridioides difficile]
MIVTLEEIKEYLRLEADYEEDDNLLLSFKSSGRRLRKPNRKVFNENNNSELVSLYIKMYVAEQYEKEVQQKVIAKKLDLF